MTINHPLAGKYQTKRRNREMIKLIQKATASSKDGAVGLIKGIIACAFQNMAFMLPTGLLYYLVKDLLGGDMGGKAVFYTVGCVICFALILITTWFQYNNTFFTTYEESGKRRLSLAERLRKLPLSFFGKKAWTSAGNRSILHATGITGV